MSDGFTCHLIKDQYYKEMPMGDTGFFTFDHGILVMKWKRRDFYRIVENAVDTLDAAAPAFSFPAHYIRVRCVCTERSSLWWTCLEVVL